jgi:hypothetical protein
MENKMKFELLEDILQSWKQVIKEDYDGYLNHCYRMIYCCFQLYECSEEDKEKIIIAAAFHDLGLWTDKTVDYLPPSIELAKNYLITNSRESWVEEISEIIDMHHKVTPYKGKYYLVEPFRRGDLADFSLGILRSGVSSLFMKKLKKEFPNKGFHKMLGSQTVKWLVKNPMNPMPIMKW